MFNVKGPRRSLKPAPETDRHAKKKKKKKGERRSDHSLDERGNHQEVKGKDKVWCQNGSNAFPEWSWPEAMIAYDS